RFVGEWGAHPGAMDVAVSLRLVSRGQDPASSAAWADRHLELFPRSPAAHKSRADVHLERGDFARCLALADAGLRIQPTHGPLPLVRLEALAALGRADEALALADACRAAGYGEAWLRHVRGLYRSDCLPEAARASHRWAGVFQSTHGVAYCLREDPLMGRDITFLACVPAFARLLREPDWLLRGAVESRLGVDPGNSFCGDIPPERVPHLRAVLPQVEYRERVLYFLDWSRWDGAGGLVVTTRRVAWKTFRQGTTVINLAGLGPDQVLASGTTVTVAGRSLDLGE